jgi:hypothetical protein
MAPYTASLGLLMHHDLRWTLQDSLIVTQMYVMRCLHTCRITTILLLNRCGWGVRTATRPKLNARKAGHQQTGCQKPFCPPLQRQYTPASSAARHGWVVGAWWQLTQPTPDPLVPVVSSQALRTLLARPSGC